MTKIFHHTTFKMTMVMLSLALLFAFTAQRAAASEGTENKNKEITDAGTTVETNTNSAATPASASPSIAYHAFSEAMKVQPEAKPVGTLAQAGIVKVTTPDTLADMPLPTPMPDPMPAVSTAPLTAGEKFHIFAKKSFLSISPYALSILSGVWGEATDKDHGRHMSAGDFLADAGTHAARGFAFRITSNFFEKFAFATILKQDPRYHRSGKKGLGAKVIYATSRVFITQGDRCGCDQVNASFLMGGLVASGISQSWAREEDKSVSKVFTSWASHIAIRAFTNIMSEFLGGQ